MATVNGGDRPLVEVRGLQRAFDGRRVLDGVDLQLRRGESLVLLGPSGGGKTLLLKHLIGLRRPDAGQLLVGGQDFWASPRTEQVRLRQRFGLAFQDGALFDSLNVFENVAFPLRRAKYGDERRIRARVEECLELMHLSHAGRRAPSQLSTGMRRRVGFARAIALEPDILLFDEPTAGLDPVMVTVVDELVVDLRRRLQTTSVVTTHDLSSARAVASRVVLLFRGKLVADAPADRFFDLPHPAVQQFVHGSLEGPLLVPGGKEVQG
ncbi:MAG: hypothetical protein RL653_2661 [Pseudomonadota bacterium]